MSWLIVPLSLLCGLVLGSTGVCVFTLYHAYCLLGQAKHCPSQILPARDPEVQSLRQSLEALAAQLHDLQSHPHTTLAPALPRQGINLNKRAHALRLSRRGGTPEQIAAELDLPKQEVDLLLKVHRIVISNL